MNEFTVPTFGIANTDPLDMTDEDFTDWLECIPEESREEWTNRRLYQFPKPAQPAKNAVLNDWRFQAYKMTMHEGTTPTGEIFSEVEIDPASKIKGKKTKATVLFTLRIPTPQDDQPTTGELSQ